LKLIGTHQHLVYADDDNILAGSTDTAKKRIGVSLEASRETLLTICSSAVNAMQEIITI